MPSAMCYHLSLSADRHRAPDEIRLLHTGIKAKPINKGKGKQGNVIKKTGWGGGGGGRRRKKKNYKQAHQTRGMTSFLFCQFSFLLSLYSGNFPLSEGISLSRWDGMEINQITI